MKYQISLSIEFQKNPHRGCYIALEGIDGSGKTTQRNALAEYFQKTRKQVTITSEPRVDLPIGDLIMQVFKSEISLPPMAFQHVLTANRLINHDQVVVPALEKGDIVFSDRSFWSAIPYGLLDKEAGYTADEAQRVLLTQSILSSYHQSIVPDMIFYIAISSEAALQRLSTRKNRENDIYEKKEKIEKVIKGYEFLMKQYPEVFIRIDGERPIDEITANLIEIISKKLP